MTQRLETGKSETYLDSWRCLSVRGSWCLAGGGRSMSLPGDGGCDAADGWRADEAPQAGGGSGRNGGGVLRELRRPVEDLFGDGDGDGDRGTDRSRDGRTSQESGRRADVQRLQVAGGVGPRRTARGEGGGGVRQDRATQEGRRGGPETRDWENSSPSSPDRRRRG